MIKNLFERPDRSPLDHFALWLKCEGMRPVGSCVLVLPSVWRRWTRDGRAGTSLQDPKEPCRLMFHVIMRYEGNTVVGMSAV